MLSMPQFHILKWISVSHFKKILNVFLLHKNICPFLVFSIFLILKGKREKMWKRVMSLVTIQWKCVLNTKQERKLTIELKIRIVQYIYRNFLWNLFLSWIVCLWAWTKQVMFNSLCLHYVKVAIEKISGPKKESFPQCSCYVLFFLAKKIFWCVLIIWLSLVHHIITI
jgi:hypothetical protein